MLGEYGDLPIGESPEKIEAEAIVRTGLSVEEREAEVQRLIAKANDPNDEYDGHHGQDRSEDSLAYADQHDPALAARIREKIATDDKGE